MLLPIFLSFFLPLIWAYYFYRKDCHPEPVASIIFAFFLGMTSAVLSLFTQGIVLGLSKAPAGTFNETSPFVLFMAAFIEEFFKFLVIFLLIFPLKVFDEPVDSMIYMIFSGFGFAFLENLLYLLPIYLQKETVSPSLVIIFRFLGPNFLHLLASALIGFGYAYYVQTRSFFPFIVSFSGAIILHFFHNYFIIALGGGGFLLVIPILWAIFALVLSEINLLETKYERRIANLKP